MKRINVERLMKTSHMKCVDSIKIIGNGGPSLCTISNAGKTVAL